MLERPIDRFVLPDDDGEAEYETRRRKWKKVREVRSLGGNGWGRGENLPLLEEQNLEGLIGEDYVPPGGLGDALRALGVPSPDALVDECRRKSVEVAERVLQWGLTIDEIAIVLSYTYIDPVRPDLSPCNLVNRVLGRDMRDRSQLVCARPFLYLLLSTLRKLPRFHPEQKRPFLYRAVPPRGDPDVPATTLYPRGTTVTWRPFVSTSLDKTSAKNILFASLAQSSAFQDSADSCNSSSSSDSDSASDDERGNSDADTFASTNNNNTTHSSSSFSSSSSSSYFHTGSNSINDILGTGDSSRINGDHMAYSANRNGRAGVAGHVSSSNSSSGSSGSSSESESLERTGLAADDRMRADNNNNRRKSKRPLVRVGIGKVFSVGGTTWGYDIGTFTDFPTEQEILLEPHRVVTIKRISTRSVSKGRFKYDMIEAVMAKSPLLFERAIPVATPSAPGHYLRNTYVLIWSPSNNNNTDSDNDNDNDDGCCCCFGMCGSRHYRPRAPKNFCAEKVLWNGASLSWDPVRASSSKGGGRRVVYQVAKQRNVRFRVRARVVYEGTDIKYDATPLNPGREYIFRVRAYDGAWSGWSRAAIVRTPSIPAPADIMAAEVKWNQIRVRWTPVASYPGRTPKYIIDLWDPVAKILQSRSGYDAHCTFSDLTADTVYELSGSAGHNNLFENKSAPVRVRTSGWPLGHWRECPHGINPNYEYELETPFLATFRGGTLGGACTVVGDTPLLPGDTNKWSIRVVHSKHNNGLCFYVGVAPDGVLRRRREDGFDTLFECGWYMCLSNFELFSGPPHNYRWKAYGRGSSSSPNDRDIEYVKRRGLKSWSSGFLRKGKTVGVSMNTVSGSLSFVYERYLGVAFSKIPLDRPLYPVVILGLCNDSVEFVTK